MKEKVISNLKTYAGLLHLVISMLMIIVSSLYLNVLAEWNKIVAVLASVVICEACFYAKEYLIDPHKKNPTEPDKSDIIIDDMGLIIGLLILIPLLWNL